MALTLRSGYDIGTMVADDPIIWVVDDFVTAAEREHITQLAAGRMNQAKVSRLGENAPSEKRTGSVAWVKHDQTPIVRGLVNNESTIEPSRHASEVAASRPLWVAKTQP